MYLSWAGHVYSLKPYIYSIDVSRTGDLILGVSELEREWRVHQEDVVGMLRCPVQLQHPVQPNQTKPYLPPHSPSALAVNTAVHGTHSAGSGAVSGIEVHRLANGIGILELALQGTTEAGTTALRPHRELSTESKQLRETGRTKVLTQRGVGCLKCPEDTFGIDSLWAAESLIWCVWCVHQRASEGG